MLSKIFNYDRPKLLAETPLPIALLVLCTPSILDTVSTYLNIAVMEAFLGHLSAKHMVAISLWLPCSFLIAILCLNSAAVGGSTTISRLLGRRRKALAESLAAGYMYNQLILTFVMIAIVYYSTPMLLKIFGATDSVMELSTTFIHYMLIGHYLFIIRFFLAGIARAEGSTIYSFISNFLNVTTSIIISYVLIFHYNFDIKGAGIGYIVGNFVGVAVLAWFFLSKRTHLHLNFRRPIFKFKHYIKYVRHGSSDLTFNTTNLIVYATVLNLINSYGDIAMASFSLLEIMMVVIFMLIGGSIQGYQAIASFCIGAKDFERFYKAYWTIVVGITMFSLPFAVICIFFTKSFISLFTSSVEVQEMTSVGLIIFGIISVTFPIGESIGGLYIALQKTLIPNMALFGRFLIIVLGSYFFVDKYGAYATLISLGLSEIGFQGACISQFLIKKTLRQFLIFKKYNDETFNQL